MTGNTSWGRHPENYYTHHNKYRSAEEVKVPYHSRNATLVAYLD